MDFPNLGGARRLGNPLHGRRMRRPAPSRRIAQGQNVRCPWLTLAAIVCSPYGRGDVSKEEPVLGFAAFPEGEHP